MQKNLPTKDNVVVRFNPVISCGYFSAGNIFQHVSGFASTPPGLNLSQGLSHIPRGIRVNTLISQIMYVCLTFVMYRPRWESVPESSEGTGGNGVQFFLFKLFCGISTSRVNIKSLHLELNEYV